MSIFHFLMKFTRIAASVIAAFRSGSPFAAVTALWPTNNEGKYVIEAEGIRLAFTRHGGALANLWIKDKDGKEIDIVLGFDTANEYLNSSRNPFLGGAIGRYASLISGASFELDGVTYNTSGNSQANGKPLTTNGGEKGWGRESLNVVSHMKDSITFVIFDGPGKNGFPGVAVSSLTHTVTPYEWKIAYGVTPVRKTSPISISNQVFWNLDGFAKGSSKRVMDHALHLPFSGLRLDTNAYGIPTGDIKGNKKNSTYDFWSSPRPLAPGLRKPDTGYDDTFLISRSQPYDWTMRPAATLASNHSGIKLDLYTDQEALHVLTWNEEDGTMQLKKGQGGTDVPQYAAVSLQMQDWTDAVNHPEWQRDDKIFWGTDRLYVTYSTYKFSVNQTKGI
ncbi:putative aldose 1-epimerase family protein [Rhexocercosporidium sp. MPI-PUGE-AT-0058]|nr:putative aldose 1-epimerase family protein [Rhexocercosporidium sp. MPI-PUGE-AT-0058]